MQNHALPEPKTLIEKVLKIWECIKMSKIMHSQNQNTQRKSFGNLGVHKNVQNHALPEPKKLTEKFWKSGSA